MNKLPIRYRMALLTVSLLLICCLGIYAFTMNSALMTLDTLETDMIEVSGFADTSIMLNLTLADIYPEVSEFVTQAKTNFLHQSILMVAAVLIFSVLATLLISKFALQPLRTLNEEIKKTTENNLLEPIPGVETRDEIAQLTDSFNQMRSRLNDAFISQKQFSANAAHELRTPLAVMQTSLEVFEKREDKTEEAYEEAIGSTLAQLDRMNRLVNTLLEYQSMHTASLEDQVCAAELADEILCDLAAVAEEKEVSLSLTVAEDAEQKVIRGNEVLIYRAIYNLTENAIKYNRPQGSVHLEVSGRDDGVLVSIEDTGIGIPKEQWETIFEPFHRVDKSRSRKSGGAGLGLAMVKEIAELHGGSVYVERSNEEGSRICIRLK